MIIMLLLASAVVLYFCTTDRRYLLLVLVALCIEALTLCLMWWLNLPSTLGYILGIAMLAVAIVALLWREDRKVQQQVKPSPIYREHTPVYEDQQQGYFAQDLKDASN